MMTGTIPPVANRDSLWVIDQIEAGWAQLSAYDFDGDPISLPEHLIPTGLREGDLVNLTLSAASQASVQARARVATQIAELTEDDDGDDFSL